MNKNKAFTLVELIAVIAILSVILVMFVPSLLNSINENKTKALNKMYDLIETAARNYVMDYNISTPTKIELEDLCKTPYIECPIINPETEEELNGYIFAGKEYYYGEDEVIKLNVNYDSGKTNQTFNESYEPGFTIELNDVSKESYTFLGWEVVEGNSVIEGNKLTIGTTKTTIKPKLVRYLNDYIKYMYDDETTRTENGLTNPKFTSNGKEYDTGIRYAGADPNNYVYFNCEDKDNKNIKYGSDNYNYASSCEVWRIIGVFDVDNGSGKIEKRVKLIREEFTDSSGNTIRMSLDSSAINISGGYGINQWGESTYEDGTYYEGADLMRLLNGFYIRKDNKCVYCTGLAQETCVNDCTNIVTPLSITSLFMLENALWNTGAKMWQDPMPIVTMYLSERGTTNGKRCDETVEYNGKKVCTDTVNRTVEWIGKIGLIYPSDYGFASTDENCSNDMHKDDSTCKNNNWLYLTNDGYYWTITASYDLRIAYSMWAIRRININSDAATYGSGVRPSLYLKSSVHTIGGNGTESSPYKLAI